MPGVNIVAWRCRGLFSHSAARRRATRVNASNVCVCVLCCALNGASDATYTTKNIMTNISPTLECEWVCRRNYLRHTITVLCSRRRRRRRRRQSPPYSEVMVEWRRLSALIGNEFNTKQLKCICFQKYQNTYACSCCAAGYYYWRWIPEERSKCLYHRMFS